MEYLIKDFLSQKSFAVAGSFRNETKFAYRILKRLKSKGYVVYPVNHHMKEVDGIECHANVNDIEGNVDCISLVTPSNATEKIVRDCRKKGIKKIWMQPGAESSQAIGFCKENNIDVIYGRCILMET